MLRAYFFGNMYLSSIQQGIQAAHALGEMFIRFPEREQDGGDFLWDWLIDYKTMILLNGGYSASIQELVSFFDNPSNPYPWAEFYEEEAALNGALTTVGIILPEHIYMTSAAIRREVPVDGILPSTERLASTGTAVYQKDGGTNTNFVEKPISKWEYDLILKLNQFGLAS